MPHPGPAAVPIVLSDDERAELVRRAGLPERRRADRARIILACSEGMSNAGAARAVGVAVKSVSKWRRKFAAERLAGLEDAAPVGRPKAELVVDEAERAQLMRWARRAKTAQFLALRAKIVLACAEGGTNKQVAADLGGWMSRPWIAGGPGSSPGGWRACMMSPGRAGRRRSCWIRSRT
jgi:transposase